VDRSSVALGGILNAGIGRMLGAAALATLRRRDLVVAAYQA